MASEEIVAIGTIFMIVLMMVYLLFHVVIEKKRWMFGHESGIVLILGMAVSYIYYSADGDEFTKFVEFDDNIFFYFCLPPILFAAGYNMRRDTFFKNIGYAILFGVIGALIAFFIFTGISYLVLYKSGYVFYEYSNKTGEYSETSITVVELLLLCALLCSSDVIAAVSVVRYEEVPDLFSIIFGEGVINDAISIILFQTVVKFSMSEGTELNVAGSFEIIGFFIYLCASSLGVGILSGIFSAFFTKNFRVFMGSPITETALLLFMGYMSYLIAEILELSGILTLLSCSVFMAAYTWYNFSMQGKLITASTLEVIAHIVEAFVFCYLGLSFFSYANLRWSTGLFVTFTSIVIVGRFLATVGMGMLIKLIVGKRFKLSW